MKQEDFMLHRRQTRMTSDDNERYTEENSFSQRVFHKKLNKFYRPKKEIKVSAATCSIELRNYVEYILVTATMIG